MRVTSFHDIAGRLAREASGADTVTVAGICLPTGATKLIRRRIPDAYPKWRNATDAHVNLIVDLLLREAVSITATAVQKTTAPWASFWNDAERTHAKTSKLSAGTMSFVKAATMLKYALFGQSASFATAHAIKIGAVQIRKRFEKELLIEEELVFDKEIDGTDNVEMFMELWSARNKHQPLTSLLGIRWNITDVRLTTEQQEPLLLLPDYIAGITHAIYSKANTLSASQVTPATVQAAHQRLRSSAKYAEVTEQFGLRYFDIFPRFASLTADAP